MPIEFEKLKNGDAFLYEDRLYVKVTILSGWHNCIQIGPWISDYMSDKMLVQYDGRCGVKQR